MTYKEFIKSKKFSTILYTVGGLLVALIIFQAGIFVGYHIASFSIGWDNSHNGNIRDPRSIFAPFGRDTDDMNAHGAIGEIISVRLPQIMVKEPSGNEAIILISSTTPIRSMRNQASTSDLTIGAEIVTIGIPDEQGQIHATFIRVVPPARPRTVSPTTSTSSFPSSLPQPTQKQKPNYK